MYFSLKNLEMLKTRLHSTRTKRKRCYDIMLSRQEGSTTHHLGSVLVLRTGQLMEAQDFFFGRLAGRSAPTELAIVHWI